MRIVLIVPAFPKLSETFIVNKFLGLLERGHDVHIVCSRSDRDEWGRFEPLSRAGLRRRVHVSWPTQPRWLVVLLFPLVLLSTLLAQPGAAARYLAAGWRLFGPGGLRRFYLDARIIRLRPDIVHFEFGTMARGRIGLGELTKCRTVVSFRGFDLNYVGLEDAAYYQEVWDRADALHLLGQDLWERAQRRGCPADKHHVLIPPAIDTRLFVPGERGAGERPIASGRPLRVVSVGRLEWKKGYEYALQAVKRVVDAGVPVEYTIVGDGKYREAVAYCRHELGLEAVVKLAGAVPPAEVREHLRRADVFLHAAVSEGFCNAVLEAQAMELPVVTSDADGLPENVEHGVTGYVVPRRDPAALAEKLILLAGDPALRQRMGQAGRERVRRCFDLDRQIDAFASLYESLTGPV